MDFLFIIYFFAGIFLMVMGIRVTKLSPFRLSVTSFLIISLIVFAYIGLFFLYFGLDPWVKDVVNEKKVVFDVLLCALWGILAIIGVKIVLDGAVIGKPSINYISSSIVGLDKSETLMLKIIFFVNVLVLIVYLSKIPEIALFVAFTRGAAAAEVARSAMGNNFQGKYHWYSLCMHDYGAILTFAAFGNWLLYRRRQDWQIFGFSFIYTGFTTLMATAKAPFAWLVDRKSVV